MNIRFHSCFSIVLLILLSQQSLMAESTIKLTVRKDIVLSANVRSQVLEVARLNLSEKEDSFLELLNDLDSPFVFEQPVEVIASAEEPVEEVIVKYDDASVLRVVSGNFAKQVRGTLARGSSSFLQLQGGSMIKPGARFPVTIPEAKGQTFELTVIEVTSESYTLQLGEATQVIRLNASETEGEGANLFK